MRADKLKKTIKKDPNKQCMKRKTTMKMKLEQLNERVVRVEQHTAETAAQIAVLKQEMDNLRAENNALKEQIKIQADYIMKKNEPSYDNEVDVDYLAEFFHDTEELDKQ